MVEDKEKIIERWDKLEFCKGFIGGLNKILSKLYEHK